MVMKKLCTFFWGNVMPAKFHFCESFAKWSFDVETDLHFRTLTLKQLVIFCSTLKMCLVYALLSFISCSPSYKWKWACFGVSSLFRPKTQHWRGSCQSSGKFGSGSLFSQNVWGVHGWRFTMTLPLGWFMEGGLEGMSVSHIPKYRDIQDQATLTHTFIGFWNVCLIKMSD